MALYQTEGVLIGSRNWGEADKMVTIFTQEKGLVEAAAFGCRRPRSPLAASMQLFSYLDLQLTEGRRLDTVKQAQMKEHYKKLSEDLTVMSYGALVAEVMREFMPVGVPEPKLFQTLLEVMEAFEKRNPRVTALAAVLQIMEFTGLQLHYEHCVHCGKAIKGDGAFSLHEGGALCVDCKGEGRMAFPETLRRTIISLRDFDWQDSGSLRLQGSLLMQAEKISISHLQYILGHSLKAMDFISQM